MLHCTGKSHSYFPNTVLPYPTHGCCLSTVTQDSNLQMRKCQFAVQGFCFAVIQIKTEAVQADLWRLQRFLPSTRTEDSTLFWIIFSPSKSDPLFHVQKCSSRGHAGIAHVLLVRQTLGISKKKLNMDKNKELSLLLLIIQGARNNFRCSSTNRTGSVFLVAAIYYQSQFNHGNRVSHSEGQKLGPLCDVLQYWQEHRKVVLVTSPVLSRTYAVCSTAV